MPTFQRCDKTVSDLAKEIIAEFDLHQLLTQCKVKIDYVFAHAPLDADGFPKGDALRHGGYRALGIARILPTKQRVLGRGDAEISLDGDWWRDANHDQRKALLDHELHHITVCFDKFGKPETDDADRPRLRMRKHDFQFGWFSIIAVRHGMSSQECLQAKMIADNAGTYLFPKAVMDSLKKAA